MRIGLIDVDGRNFPNFALMRLSAWHKYHGDSVEWADPLFGHYDRIYKSKIFTFSPDDTDFYDCEIIKGGTGYDVTSKLPEQIESFPFVDYSIYPEIRFSVQFFSRGCIRSCPFCLVSKKEGFIRPAAPVNLNPNGEWIEVLDNNFFANPDWHNSVEYLVSTRQPINLHGVDVRILNEEQCFHLNRLRLKQNIHIAWDLPIELEPKLREIVRYIKPRKLTCYVLIGYGTTPEFDLHRLSVLKELGITPFVQPYRDYDNARIPTQYERDLSRWANRTVYFKSSEFKDFEIRKGFKCGNHLQ